MITVRIHGARADGSTAEWSAVQFTVLPRIGEKVLIDEQRWKVDDIIHMVGQGFTPTLLHVSAVP